MSTHRGGAYGHNEQTINAPDDYHDQLFHTKGYLFQVLVMEMKGVHPDVLAGQRVRASLVLNDGVTFSLRDYKNDIVRHRRC